MEVDAKLETESMDEPSDLDTSEHEHENENENEIDDFGSMDSLLIPAVEMPDGDDVNNMDSASNLEATSHKCDVCDKSFTRRAHLLRHVRLHTGEKPYACPICSKRFNRSEPRNVHMNKEHPEFRSDNCTICGKAYVDENDRIEHTKSHMEKRYFRCTMCPREFHKASALAGHMQIHSGHEPLMKRVHKCTICQMEFSRYDHLIRHQTVHSGLKLFECQRCFKRFTRADNRKKHESTCKGDGTSTNADSNLDQSEDEPNSTMDSTLAVDPLEIINVSSILEQDFENIDTETNAIDFFDDMNFFDENGDEDDNSLLNGPKSAAMSDSLRRSQLEADIDLEKMGGIRQRVPRPKLTQEEIDTLTCSICLKTLAQKYHLVRHKITHLGDQKPYKCTICQKTFSRREHLKHHLFTHKRQTEKLTRTIIVPQSKYKKVLRVKPTPNPKYFEPEDLKPTINSISSTSSTSSSSLRLQLLQRFKVFAIKLKQKNPLDYYEQCFDFMGNLFLSNLQSINSETFASKRQLSSPASAVAVAPASSKAHIKIKAEELRPATMAVSSIPSQLYRSRDAPQPGRKLKIYECDVCGRGFKRAEHKRRHMAIHSKSTPYNCEICQRKFSRSDHMVQHFRVHHVGVKPYRCRNSNCSERFDTYKEKLVHGRNCMHFTMPSTSGAIKTEFIANGIEADDIESPIDDEFITAATANADDIPNFQSHFIKTESDCPDDGYDPVYGY